MRHLKLGRKLGVSSSHRKAMMRNLVTALLEHGRIKTTTARAKEMRRPLDKMIGLAKRGDLHARRQALSFVKSKKAMAKLFDEYAALYANRNGGYSRIYSLGTRLGDNASMSLIELVDVELGSTKSAAPSSKNKSSSQPEAEQKSALEDVKSELEANQETAQDTAPKNDATAAPAQDTAEEASSAEGDTSDEQEATSAESVQNKTEQK